ncbi:ABC transporter permease subunit [Rossellomorea yichunensis]|uniref:ABC transporter permease subunit n=1 Tax=Rossellomorea yichunensis TaxID=3077331 RepID=UPI0028DF7293|nr:ABC transporter permease subunit [Rossellomorea sp. YC4-1]MDT9024201.1 ABC transporter permease subunit [Rossellomorea sp. YC4-1]
MKSNRYDWMSFIGFSSILIVLLSWSMAYNLSNEEISQTLILFNDEGKVLGDSPFPPSIQFPFGTDRDGYHMTDKIIQGAQYTLGAAITISLLSFLLAFLFGIAGGFTKSRLRIVTQKVFTSLYFIPQSIIAYNILHPLLWEPTEGFQTSLVERMVVEIVVLAIIVTPTTAILIANEAEQILQEEFIISSRVLGARSFYIFYKHLMPHLKNRLFVIYPKIVIQVLLIIAHLGFFTLFFGGTDICYQPFCHPPKPFVQEWSGLMGTNYSELYNAWWIFLMPMICFALTILLLNGIAHSLERILERNVSRSNPTVTLRDNETYKPVELNEESFTLRGLRK